jgi:hypothetical protein
LFLCASHKHFKKNTALPHKLSGEDWSRTRRFLSVFDGCEHDGILAADGSMFRKTPYRYLRDDRRASPPHRSGAQHAPLLSAREAPCGAEHAVIQFAMIHSSNIRVVARGLMTVMNVLTRCVAEHAVIQFAVIHAVNIRICWICAPGLCSQSQETCNRHTTKNDQIPRHTLSPAYGSR